MELQAYIKSSEKLLRQLPSQISIMDTDNAFAWASDKVISSYGFNALNEMIGKKYLDLNCRLSEDYQILTMHDQLVISKNKKMAFMGYHEFVDGWKITMCEKSPILNDDNTVIGLITSCNDVTPYAMIDTNQFIFKLFTEFKKGEQLCVCLDRENIPDYGLSQRQQECLFYLLRGKSDKDIAKRLNISSRTVESYINEIKHKMNCNNRSEIIEKSLNEGLLHHFLFQKKKFVGLRNIMVS
ncbi:MAG: LuxR C-terminal-related transcriptional regulator [Legionellales bacterium]|jgi:DNA-binding CsgD family transcriptional regulator